MKKIMIIALLGIVTMLAPSRAMAAAEQWKYGQGISITLKNGENVNFSSESIEQVIYVGESIGFKVYLINDRVVDFLYSQVSTVTYIGQGEEPPIPDNNLNKNTLLNKCPEAWRLEFPHMHETGNQSYVTKRTNDFGITYSAEWDNDLIANRWSVYEMYAGNLLDNCSRKDDFKEDPELPAATRSTLADYSSSGFSRGHLCPSADRLCSTEQNKQTFFLSNMQPQYQFHNGGQWAVLEGKVRTWAEQCDTLYVVKAATIGDVTINGVTQTGLRPELCNNRLIVPKYFYMALMKYNKSTDTYSAVGIWTYHSKNSSEKIEQYITIDELEARTGIDFFCNLPDDVETEVEQIYNANDWK